MKTYTKLVFGRSLQPIRDYRLSLLACFTALMFACEIPVEEKPVVDEGIVTEDKTTCDTGETKHGFKVADAACMGLSNSAIAALLDHASQNETDALILLHKGKLVLEWYPNNRQSPPIMAMSASKSITSLAVGMAIDDGVMSLDQHPAEYFEPWAHDPEGYGQITIQQLLSQTSGIDAESRAISMRDYLSEVELNYTPGSSWRYSNAGIDSLALFVELTTGMNMKDYLNERLFIPIGAEATDWVLSSDGVPFGAGELMVNPIDLARVGQLLLNGGLWQGQQIISQDYIQQMQQPSSSLGADYGLAWWLDADIEELSFTADILLEWRGYGLSASVADALETIVGRSFDSQDAFGSAVYGVLEPNEVSALNDLLQEHAHASFVHTTAIGPIRAYYANGWMGQYLWIDEAHQLVAVRMHAFTLADQNYTYDRYFVEYFDLPNDLNKLFETP